MLDIEKYQTTLEETLQSIKMEIIDLSMESNVGETITKLIEKIKTFFAKIKDFILAIVEKFFQKIEIFKDRLFKVKDKKEKINVITTISIVPLFFGEKDIFFDLFQEEINDTVNTNKLLKTIISHRNLILSTTDFFSIGGGNIEKHFIQQRDGLISELKTLCETDVVNNRILYKYFKSINRKVYIEFQDNIYGNFPKIDFIMEAGDQTHTQNQIVVKSNDRHNTYSSIHNAVTSVQEKNKYLTDSIKRYTGGQILEALDKVSKELANPSKNAIEYSDWNHMSAFITNTCNSILELAKIITLIDNRYLDIGIAMLEQPWDGTKVYSDYI